MSHKSVRLRILHISDLHERAEREKEPWRRRRVLGDAWDANIAEILQDGPIDLVCFTGDAADRGKRAEFSAAAEFLHALLVRLNLPKERLFVVPGNHDVDRKIQEEAWKKVREAAAQVDSLALARWLHGMGDPPGFRDEWRKQVFARFAAYRKWVRDDLGRPELVRPAKVGGPHAYRVDLDIRGAAIHVIGLDSAWLCGDRYEAGQLRVTDEQVMRHLTRDGDDLEGFRLVLMHHPLDDLDVADRNLTRRCLAENADLVLRGHLHSPEVSIWQDPNHELRHLAAGCLYEGHLAEQYPNGCQVLTLEIDSSGRSAEVDLRLRSFSPRGGHYFDDGSLYRNAKSGRLSFCSGRTAKAEAEPENPFDPYNPALPPRFFGREVELRTLEASLLAGHGVSIVGDWRIGKTSLLRTWELKARDLGRTTRFLDGQGPEGASIQTMVSAILDAKAPESADTAADVLLAWANQHPEGLAPVLLIDELDGVVPRFDPRFFERIRNMLGKVIVAVASRRPVDLLYKEHGLTSPFASRLETVRLGLLKAKAAEQLTASSLDLNAEEQNWLRHWAGSHAFHLQLLGRCLIQAKRFGESRDEALDRYFDEAFSRLRELWSRLSLLEQESLKATIDGQPTNNRSLRRRGLVTEAGLPFGEVLATWLREEI